MLKIVVSLRFFLLYYKIIILINRLNPFDSCSCKVGFTGDGVSCVDSNECEAQTDDCAADAKCKNTIGSYDCTCENGYSGDGFVCNDINECAVGTDLCSDLASCHNTEGSYDCICTQGYDGDGRSCEDVDECQNNACDENASVSILSIEVIFQTPYMTRNDVENSVHKHYRELFMRL